MKHSLVISFVIALCVVQFACVPTPTAAPVQPIGRIDRLQGGVQAGPINTMTMVDPTRDLYNSDTVHVFNSGKANLDFGYGLVFTMYNDTIGGGTSVDAPRQVFLKLSQGGLKGYNPPGSVTRVNLPNGVNIFILGTHYFITYDPIEDQAFVYNFDGAVQYQLPNGGYQGLAPGVLLKINQGQSIQLYYGLQFSENDFDAYVTIMDSPILGVKEMVDRTLPIGIPITGATNTPIIVPTDTLTATPTNTPTATAPPPTSTPIPCHMARFVKDITVPDGTIMNPNAYFTKTWRLKNVGSCAWDANYRIVYVDGTPMSEAKTFAWTGGIVGYGDSVDLSVSLMAPYLPGAYQANFMLLAPDGTYIGLGIKNQAFWAKIVVALPPNQSPPTPGIVSPQKDGMLYCYSTSKLDWDVPYDESGIAQYEVMLEKSPASCSSGCSVFGSNSMIVITDYLDVSQYLECTRAYRWSVRAMDKEGAWSVWSEWIYFTVDYGLK